MISVLGDAKKKHSQYQLETSCRGGGSYLVSSVKKVTSPKRLLGGNATHTALKYITGDFYNEKLETGKEKMKFCKKRTKTPVEKKKKATKINMRNEALLKLWLGMVIELVRKQS